MSGSVRYSNPIICNHLASQYVVGVMTPRVRTRVEALRFSVTELDAAIISWSEDFSQIHTNLPEKTPLSSTWSRIAAQIADATKTGAIKASWWSNLNFWRLTGISATVASFALLLMLLVLPIQSKNPTPLISGSPSYVAVMSPSQPKLKGEKEVGNIRFVINVYQKTETTPSRLFVQWSERQPRSNQASMYLWAKDFDTGELTYVGVEPSGEEPWKLTKTTWGAVANSSVLFFTADSKKPTAQNTLYSGPCIQLGSWKQNLT
jgi:hypothetical protein